MDGEGRRFARQYVHTAGRTRSGGASHALETLVVRTDRGAGQLDRLPPTHRRVVELSAAPISIAELGAALQLHAGIIRVVVSDLIGAGSVVIEAPGQLGDRPDLATLHALLRDLETLS